MSNAVWVQRDGTKIAVHVAYLEYQLAWTRYYRERAFKAWQRSGYRDTDAHDEFIRNFTKAVRISAAIRREML